MERHQLDKRDTDFVRENMLINYCLGNNDELPIDSFMCNNQVAVHFDPQHFYFFMTGVHNKFIPLHTPETFSRGITETLNLYDNIQAFLRASGYDGNTFLIKEDNSKQLGVLFSPMGQTACTPLDAARRMDAIYRQTRTPSPYISSSLVGPYSGYHQAHQAFIDGRALNDLLFFGLRGCVITESLRRETAKPCDVTAILANVRALGSTLCGGTLKKALSQAEYIIDTLVAPSYSMQNYHAMGTAVDDLLGMLQIVYPERIDIHRQSPQQFDTLLAYKDYLLDILRTVFAQLQGVRRYSPSILLALSFINRNYTQPLSLSQLSEYVYTNASSLSSEFNAEVGMKLSEYMTALRIAHAKRLLHDSALTIAEIAAQSGFTDAKYFREIFKRHENCSPQQYRMQAKARE